MFDLAAIQAALREFGLDGWLLYDFRGSNVLARRILDLAGRADGLAAAGSTSSRPSGAAAKARPPHRDRRARPPARARRRVYLRWQELEAGVARAGRRRAAGGDGVLAAQRQPVRLARRRRHGRAGPRLRRRGRLVGRPDPAVRGDLGRRAVGDAPARPRRTRRSAYDVAWSFIAERVRDGGPVARDRGAGGDHGPLRRQRPDDLSPADRRRRRRTAATRTTSPTPATDTPIREGDFVLIDLWAKLDQPRAVYSDLTRVGFVGETVPDEYERDLPHRRRGPRRGDRPACSEAFAAGQPLQGWEVDDAAPRR